MSECLCEKGKLPLEEAFAKHDDTAASWASGSEQLTRLGPN
jgi:hypothetical protein